MESDSNGTGYGNSFTLSAAVATFGNATISQTYGQIGADALANASQIGTGANIATSTYASGVLNAGNAYSAAVNAPVIVVNENGVAAAGAWTTVPTAYSIWGHQSNGTYFCIDSTGNTKNGTNAAPTTITCQ